MRLFFFLLLLANVAFYAYANYLADGRSIESQLLDQQINPEKIRVLSSAEVAARAVRRPDAPAAGACLELGAFGAIDAAKVQEALVQLALGERLSQRTLEESAGYWVFMPSQGSRQGALQKAAELKRLGITEFFVVQDDPKFRFAISLGVFKTEDAARTFLDQLRGKGVRTAQLGPREAQVQKIYFQVRNVAEPVVSRLNDLKQGFPGSELKECGALERRG